MPGPTPALLLAAAGSKPVRRLVLAVAGVMVALTLAVLSPLLAVPAMLTTGHGAVAGVNPGPAVVGAWGYPLSGEYTKSRGFGWHPVEGCAYCSAYHTGYDMAQPCGATVHAAGAGTVTRAGAWGGLGNAVQIDHGGGVTTIYGHMMWDSLLVSTGMVVTPGTPIGRVGTTGTSTGCHLHFEIRVNDTPVDPEPFMAARGLPLK